MRGKGAQLKSGSGMPVQAATAICATHPPAWQDRNSAPSLLSAGADCRRCEEHSWQPQGRQLGGGFCAEQVPVSTTLPDTKMSNTILGLFMR